MSARVRTTRRRAGLTMIELVLALGLLMLLMVAVFTLIDRCLSMWRGGETRRGLLEMSTSVQELLAGDLRGLEPGARGDLVAEWVTFDTDGDGTLETKWPRLRLVRQASAPEIDRVRQRGAAKLPENDDGSITVDPAAPGLLEVVWLVVPASTRDKLARGEGVLWRGERLVSDARTKSFFAPDFFGASNRPPAGVTEPVTGGILWMNVLFATQTSIVHDGWNATGQLDSIATSWDAWGKHRPVADIHPWNEATTGMPQARERALLPRRVRIELELERAADRIRRTTIVEHLETNDGALRVDDPSRVPRGAEVYVLVDAEWMRVRSVDGNQASVERGQRGTRATAHEAGSMVHWGERTVRELAIATYREDWDLR